MDLLDETRMLVHTEQLLRQPETGFEWNDWANFTSCFLITTVSRLVTFRWYLPELYLSGNDQAKGVYE